MSTLKWGHRPSSAIIRAFLQTVFLCFSGPTTRCFLNSKRVEVFQKAKINLFIVKGTPLEASYYGFYKDKHRKFCAILTEVLSQFGILRYMGYFESLLHLSENKTIFSLGHVLGP